MFHPSLSRYEWQLGGGWQLSLSITNIHAEAPTLIWDGISNACCLSCQNINLKHFTTSRIWKEIISLSLSHTQIQSALTIKAQSWTDMIMTKLPESQPAGFLALRCPHLCSWLIGQCSTSQAQHHCGRFSVHQWSSPKSRQFSFN